MSVRACTLFGARDLRLTEHGARETLGEDEVRVAYATGGICGSDLHYYHEGRVGNFAVREPLILGHEIAGTVAECGAAVTDLAPGRPVAINPNLPCLACESCLAGRTNLCREMIFFGSAAVTPHVQGGFREELVVPRRQCVPLPEGFDLSIAAFAEPLAVCLHAVARAGTVTHRTALVTGCGPIGCLTIQALGLAGVRRVVATDVEVRVLEIARGLGADETIDVARNDAALAPYVAGRGHFDLAFECSGNPRALATCLEAVKPRGTIVQVGMMPPGDTALPLGKLVSKELALEGTFRFHEEFDLAVDALVSGRLDVSPLLTGSFSFDEADAAFAAALDRSRHMKVQLTPG